MGNLASFVCKELDNRYLKKNKVDCSRHHHHHHHLSRTFPYVPRSSPLHVSAMLFSWPRTPFSSTTQEKISSRLSRPCVFHLPPYRRHDAYLHIVMLKIVPNNTRLRHVFVLANASTVSPSPWEVEGGLSWSGSPASSLLSTPPLPKHLLAEFLLSLNLFFSKMGVI